MRGIFGIPKAASPIFSDPPLIDPTSLSQPFLAAEHTHGFPHGTGFQILLMKKKPVQISATVEADLPRS